jgi:hypothetical protein
LLSQPYFEIEVLLTAEEEYRHLVAGKCWRRKGWTVIERRLVEILDRVVLAQPADLVGLVRADLPVRFTTAELAVAIGRPRRIGQHLAYCLAKGGVIEGVGKRGHAVEYRFLSSE